MVEHIHDVPQLGPWDPGLLWSFFEFPGMTEERQLWRGGCRPRLHIVKERER